MRLSQNARFGLYVILPAFLAVILLFVSLAGWAQGYHAHVWIKDAQWQATGAAGQVVQMCSWKCLGQDGRWHYTQTSGPYSCPFPY